MSKETEPALATITFRRDALSGALAEAIRVVERRTTIPIIANLLLTAEGGTATITATDLDLAWRGTVEPVGVEGRFATTLPAEKLKTLIGKADGDEIVIALAADGHTATVKCGRSRWKLQVLPVDDFPAFDDGEAPHRFSVPAKSLATAFDAVAFAINKKPDRFYLCGVCISLRGKGLDFVTTDGHRLSLITLPAPDGSKDMPQVIVPEKAVTALTRLAAAADGDIELGLSTSHIIARARIAGGRTVTLRSKLIDGTFPDYMRVIPSGNDKRAEVRRAGLAATADRVGAIGSDRGRAVALAFDRSRLRVWVKTSDGEEAEEEIEGDFPFDATEICVNGRYLADVLASFGSDLVELRLEGAGSPILFAEPGRENRLAVLMPMRI